MNPVATDPVAVSINNTVDEVGDSKVNGKKVSTKTAKSKSQDKTKGNNLVKSFLVKSKAFDSGSRFFTIGARQVFTKLRQAFIEVPILHHFELDCYF